MGFLHSMYVRLRRRSRYRRCLGSSVPLLILRYHSVADPGVVSSYLDPSMTLPPERFREQVAFLGRRFDLVGMDEALEILNGSPRTRRALAITFDDGYRDNHDHALPILEGLGAPATFYVSTGPLDSGRGLWISELWRLVPRLPAGRLDLPGVAGLEVPAEPSARRAIRRSLTTHLSALGASEREAAFDRLAELAGTARGQGLESSFMTPDQVRALRRAGMTVGAHTRTHPCLDLSPEEGWEEEIAGSRRDLEDILGEPVLHFAYPNPGGAGLYGDASRAAIARAGFRTSVTSKAAPLSPETDLLRLPRMGVYRGEQERTLFACLEAWAS